MKNDFYPKLCCVTLLLIIHLFFNNHVFASSRIIFQDFDLTIDSLLLEGDVNAVKVKYDNYEYETYTSEELEVLFINIDFITTLDLNRMDEYVSHYKTLAPQYYIEYVGDNAYKAYEKFLELSNQMVKTEALKYYYISLFFKIHHFNTVLTTARSIYTHANQLCSDLKFNEALDTIDNFTIISGQNVKLMAIEDSLEFLRQDIFNQQIEYNRLHKTGSRTYKIFIGIMPSVQYNPAVSDVTIKIENAVTSFLDRIYPTDTKEVHISNIPPVIGFELSLGINYSVLRKLMIGLDLGYAALSMNSDYNESAYENQILYKFKLRSIIFKPYIKYSFREEIGLRPFISVGLGYQRIQYDDAVVGSHVSSPLPGLPTSRFDYGDFAAKSENRTGAIFEIGVEYLTSTTTDLMFGSKIAGDYFFNQSNMLNNYNITFSVYAGLIL